jgi:hypothetical protein
MITEGTLAAGTRVHERNLGRELTLPIRLASRVRHTGAQCDSRTGSSLVPTTLAVAPPKINSRHGAWP